MKSIFSDLPIFLIANRKASGIYVLVAITYSSCVTTLHLNRISNNSLMACREALLEGEDPHLQSNWDDGDGYYKPRIGELIGNYTALLLFRKLLSDHVFTVRSLLMFTSSVPHLTSLCCAPTRHAS
jgi:hypothetical protein